MEYYENGGGAAAHLSWSSASNPKEIIPQSQLIPPSVELFQNNNYGGWKAGFGIGNYTMAQLAAAGGINDDASSLKVPLGWKVTLYTNDNFTGTATVKTANDGALSDDGINDMVSSLKVELN
jgi:hypothetical protein